MGHQPDPDVGPAGDPDPEPPASPSSPDSPGSGGSTAFPASPDSAPSPASPAPGSSSASPASPGSRRSPASPSSADAPGSPASQGSPDPSDSSDPSASASSNSAASSDSPASADAPGPSGTRAQPGTQADPGTPTGPGAQAGPGGAPREALLAGFAPGGPWDTRPPGPDLAAALATAAGPQWRCRGASGDQIIGILGRFAAVESWAAAGKLGVIRSLIRDDDPALLCGSRHGDLPDVWDDALASEVALALAASVPSADKTMRAAWELGARLPEIGTLLETGVLDAPKARLVAEVFADLSDENAGQAEALLVPELTAPPAKTYAQVEHIATAIALTVDPHSGERRRKAAEKHAARVQMFRERAGTAGLSGRDLPTDQTLAAYANVNARANQYKDSAAFAKTRIDQLRAAAYLDILNSISAEDRIAHGLLTEQTPAGDGADADAGADEDPGPAPSAAAGADPGARRDGPAAGSRLPDLAGPAVASGRG